MLPVIYAQALHKSSVNKTKPELEVLLRNLRKILVRKGHTSLFPAVVREYEKIARRATGEDQGVLEVVTQKDATRLAESIAQACTELKVSADALEVRENPRLIGGFLLRKKASQVDATYRRKLIELYRQLVAA